MLFAAYLLFWFVVFGAAFLIAVTVYAVADYLLFLMTDDRED